jgi:tetraacyldisaccharide 4'-kinase
MRAPEFWRRQGHPAARALSPLGAAYGVIAEGRLKRVAPRADLPVIVIGGLTAGGDGKTPLALAVAALLEAMGERPAFLTRGFGRQRGALHEPFAVDLARHGARETGDEAQLLARAAMTIIGANRAAGARLARELGASVLVLDDGLHSRALAPDLALLAVDAGYGAGNGLCLPAGPLRAPLAAQLAAMDALVLIGEGRAGEALAARAEAAGKIVLRGRLAPDPKAAANLAGEKVFAFAGVARPGKFFHSLREVGAEVVGVRWFPDHHFFTLSELAALERDASRLNAKLATTEKDAARIGGAVEALPITLAFDDPALLRATLNRLRSP